MRESLDALSLDALVVTSAVNIRYLSNHAGSAGILVLTRDGVHLLVDFRYRDAVRMLQESPAACPGLRAWDVPASYDEALLACLQKSVVHRWIRGRTRHGLETRLVAANLCVPRSRHYICSTERVVEQARLIKDTAEIETLWEAARRLSDVATAAFAGVREGVSERHVAGAIESAMRAAGYERVAFDTIVGSGPNAALPHYRAGDRMLSSGDLVVLDFGGVLDGYCCDLTRTVSIGPPSERPVNCMQQFDAQRAARGRAARRRNLGGGCCGSERSRGAWPRRCIRPRHRTRTRASIFTKSLALPGRVLTFRR